jgi:protein O-mannosyl-transferase
MNRKSQLNQPIKKNKNFSLRNFPPYIYLSGIIVLTFSVYFNSFFFEFNYRDYVAYVINNHLIRDLSPNGLKRIFTELYYNGHLPLTMLSLAIDYHFWQLEPLGYHITNFSLHVINIILVYFFIKKISNNISVALLSALIFAVHPMGVQSVSWIAERKNVLYATFYLVCLIQYVNYIKSKSMILFFLSWFLFVCSVASKWSAFPLCGVLLIFDWYYNRKINAKLIFEKVLFFAVPIISAQIHFNSGAVVPVRFSYLNHLFFGSYSFLFYFVKSLLPIKLSTLYPYPRVIDNQMPPVFYLSMPAALGVAGLIFFRVYKYVLFRKEIVFGFLFFLINISMVLHVLKFIGGHEMTADRYGYVPFIGMYFIFSTIIIYYWNHSKGARKLLAAGLIAYVGYLSIYTIFRNEAWRDTVSIYKDALDKNENIPIVYAHLANYYMDHDKNKEAFKELNECIKKFSYYRNCIFQRGILYYENGFYKEAKTDFLKALSMDTTDKLQYNYLGLVEMNSGNYELAVTYFFKSLSIDSLFASVYNNLGWAYFNLNKYPIAEQYLNKAIILDDTIVTAYLNRGWLFIEQEKYSEAVNDFNIAIKLKPDNALAFNNRGWAYFNMNRYEEAMKDFNSAININPKLNFSYYNRGRTHFVFGNMEAGCADLKKAAELNNEFAANMLKEKCPGYN